MSLSCLNLCHRIQFQSNIIIIPTIQSNLLKKKEDSVCWDTGFLQEFYNYLDLTAFQHVF